MRVGLVERKLENAAKDGDDRLDKLQQRLDDTQADLKRKEKYVCRERVCKEKYVCRERVCKEKYVCRERVSTCVENVSAKRSTSV